MTLVLALFLILGFVLGLLALMGILHNLDADELLPTLQANPKKLQAVKLETACLNDSRYARRNL